MTTIKCSSSELKVLIEQRYAAPEWATFFEVADQTGGANRRADAMAFNLWPSRGLEVHGFEIKVSRSDWLNELKNPAKSQNIQKFCHNWWVITPPNIVKDGELPATWGLMECSASKRQLRIVTKAPRLEPEQMTNKFMAAILRCASEQNQDPQWYQDKLNAEIARMQEDRMKEREDNIKYQEQQRAEQNKWFHDFKEQHGVFLSRYDIGQISEFFQLWKNQKNLAEFKRQLELAQHQMNTVKPMIDKVLEHKVFKVQA